MARRLIPFIALLLVAAACSDEQPQAPEVIATTPVTTSTLAAPETVAVSSTTATTQVVPTTSNAPPSTVPIEEIQLQLVEVARGFEQPVLVLSPPQDERIFVVDQPGRIWVVDGAEPSLFVDLTDDVIFGGERGLLGLAFHPDFAENGRLFVDYIGDRGQTRLVELAVAADGRTVNPASQQILLEIDQPARNHNGGMIAFGPDGYLWVATGDGGGANDEFGQGQRADTLLAALLRIDVAVPGEYTVPADNPFVDGGGAPEVYSYGLRNPWRFAFDGDTIFVADVGQRNVEEVNVIAADAAAGANFGWPIYEGSECFRGPCDPAGIVLPVVEYSHSQGCSITGGFVYRGQLLPELDGHYFYGDYCDGWVRSLSPDGVTFEWLGADDSRAITSFGQDSAGEIYVVVQNGSVFRIERA